MVSTGGGGFWFLGCRAAIKLTNDRRGSKTVHDLHHRDDRHRDTLTMVVNPLPLKLYTGVYNMNDEQTRADLAAASEIINQRIHELEMLDFSLERSLTGRILFLVSWCLYTAELLI